MEVLPFDSTQSFLIEQSNAFDEPAQTKLKFILSSKETFAIEVKLATGQVQVNIGLDPDQIDEQPIWSLQQSTGTGFIEVATDDPKFIMGTNYYMSVTLTGEDSDAIGSIKLTQVHRIEFLANDVSKKL